MTEKIAIREVQSLEQDSGLVILYEIELSSSSSAYFAPIKDNDDADIQM